VYYQAKELAINNGRTYHLAAILRRNGKIVRIGENTNKTHPRFKRQYEDGTWASHMHAEMNVLRFAQPGDVIEVMRFSACGNRITMAKPCRFCETEMKISKIKQVFYTDWNGKWQKIRL
tara:strand:+ start:200 stop:556 length:357 start_codon:yes stop_codon:yes gene_type:complete